MNRLEKVLQNDDSAFIYFVKLSKSVSIILSFYIFSILENNSIYELLDKEIYISSKYFFFFNININNLLCNINFFYSK